MFENILKEIANLIINIISSTGYVGIFILMSLESACIPIPSEITMPFSGSLVSQGRFSLIGISLVGALGNLIGSLIAYLIGFWGQEAVVRKLIKNYGKFILLSEDEFDKAESWFRKYGEIIVFTSRLVPVIRTFISLPAGIAKMDISKFIIYTSIGSFLWSLILAYIGMVLGKNWQLIENYFHKFDLFIGIILFGGLGFYLIHKIKKIKNHNYKKLNNK